MCRCSTRVGFLALIIIFMNIPQATTSFTPQVIAESPFRWKVVSEGATVSKYMFTLDSTVNALRFVLYMNSRGDINSDSIKIVVEGATIVFGDSSIEYRRGIVGYTRIGYNGDEKATARGLHVIYYVFPNLTYVYSTTIELYSEHGYPKLDTSKSWVEPLNMTMFYWSLKDEKYSYGTHYSGAVNPVNGELKVAAVSHGVPVGGYSRSSGVSYFYGRAFKPDMVGPVDMYIDVGYMGGFNIAPQSYFGSGKYTIKLDVGVEQSSEVSKVLSDPDYETIFYEEGGEGIVELASGFAADRVEDVMLDLIVDYGIEFISSPIGKAVLRFIPYIGDIIEWIKMGVSLTYDEIINGSKRVVFSNIRIDPRSGDYIYIWTHFIGLTESTGLSTNIINFCGDPPWENFLDKYFGAGVWRLKYGGIYVGGVALDYFDVPEVVSELPYGGVYPATLNISVKFSKPIDRGSLPPYTDSIKVYLNSAEVPFFEYFRYSLSKDNTTLFIYPSYHLEYNCNYVILLTRRIRGINSSNIVKSYEIMFNTEYRKQVEPEVYYVLPIAGPYEIRGVLFAAYPRGNAFVDWGRATLSGAPLYIDDVEVEARYVGEAAFYTNDVNIDYYDGGFGRIYFANNTLWFIPFTARDGGFPPKRGALVFRVGEQANIIHRKSAKIAILKLEEFGNPKVRESLKSAGLFEGAVFGLEPMPIANYEVISISKAGEGVLISGELNLNGTKVSLYIVDAEDMKIRGLDKLVEGYNPMFNIYLGGSSPLRVDIFVFIIANSTYMRAWRLVPLSYTTTTTQTTQTTTSASLPKTTATLTSSVSQQPGSTIPMLEILSIIAVITVIAVLALKFKVFKRF